MWQDFLGQVLIILLIIIIGSWAAGHVKARMSVVLMAVLTLLLAEGLSPASHT